MSRIAAAPALVEESCQPILDRLFDWLGSACGFSSMGFRDVFNTCVSGWFSLSEVSEVIVVLLIKVASSGVK